MAKKFDFKRIAMKAVGVGAGAVIGTIANKPLANLNPKIRSIGKIVAGAVLGEVVKSEFVENMGSGIIAVGASELFSSMTSATATVQGVGEAYDTALGATEDYQVTESVSGTDEEALAGVGATDNEYAG
jgi:hypothetical protein